MADPRGTGPTAWVFGVVAVLVVLAALQTHPWVNQDVAFNFVTGRQMVEGARLYVDWIDNNPPTIYLFSALISGLTGGDARLETAAYHGFVLVVAAGGWWRLRRHLEGAPGLLLPAAQAFLLVVAGLSTFDFGQREHLFVLLFLPWVAVRLAGGPTSAGSLVHGLLVGIFATMKPHFVLLLGVAELWTLLRRRRVSWELLALAAGGALPVIALGVTAPASLHAFLYELVPAELRGGPDRYDSPPSVIWERLGPTTTWAGLAALGALAAGVLRREQRGMAVGWGLLTALAVASVWQQGRFYSYHFLLPAGCLLFGLASVWHPLLERGAAGTRLAGVALVQGLLLAGAADLGRTMLASAPHPAREVGEALGDHRNVLFVSTSVEHVFAYHDRPVHPVGRWSFHFRLPALQDLPYDERETALDAYAEDLRAELEASDATAVVFSPNNQAMWPFYRYTWPALHPWLAERLGVARWPMRAVDQGGIWLIAERPDVAASGDGGGNHAKIEEEGR